MPATNGTDEYIQIETDDPITLKSVGTKGRGSDGNYVTRYIIATSPHGQNWTFYEEENGDNMVSMSLYYDEKMR